MHLIVPINLLAHVKLLMGFGDKDSLDTETQLRKGAVIRNGKGGREQKGQKGLADALVLTSHSILSFVGDIPGMAATDGLIDLVAHTVS